MGKAAPPPPGLEPSTLWVPHPKSREWLACKDRTVSHLRSGACDIVRGPRLEYGRYRLVFDVLASTNRAHGIVIGLCDAAAWMEKPDVAASAIIREAFGIKEREIAYADRTHGWWLNQRAYRSLTSAKPSHARSPYLHTRVSNA